VPGDQLIGHDRGLPLGEDSRLGRADAGHVAHRVDVGVSGFEGERVDRDPAVDAHPGLGHDRGYPVDGHREEQVGGIGAPSGMTSEISLASLRPRWRR